MAYWFGNRTNETYTYRRVSWATWQELEEYDNIISGELDFAELSDAKVSGTLTFEGGNAPDTVDLVRIYYSFEDDFGEKEQVCLATCFVRITKVTVEATYDGADVALRRSGPAELTSVLKVPRDRILGVPLTVPAGTNAVEYVKAALEGMGLRVSADESSYTVTRSYTFEPSDSWLTVLNTVLGWAGFASMKPDAYGTVVLHKYVPPTKREPVVTWRNDDESIMYPEVGDEHDVSDTPNVVRLSYQTDEECLYAVASNVDPLSEASLPSRGNRELTLQEEVTELSGLTRAERIQNLISMAEQRLLDNSVDIRYVEVSHAYIPLNTGDAGAIEYSDMTWAGTEMEMNVTLLPSTKAVSRLRSFATTQLQIESTGGVLWAL